MKEVFSSFWSFSAKLGGLGSSTSRSDSVVPEPLPSISAKWVSPHPSSLELENISSQTVSDLEKGENSASASEDDSSSEVEVAISSARYLFQVEEIVEQAFKGNLYFWADWSSRTDPVSSE